MSGSESASHFFSFTERICAQCPIRVVVEAPENDLLFSDFWDSWASEIKMSQKLDVLIKRYCSDYRLDPER